MTHQIFHSGKTIDLESGERLSNVSIAYHTYGTYVKGASKVIWVCHALTANSEVADWWNNIFGASKILDPERYFIVCANNLGSCYGTTSPVSVNPATGEKYGRSFPDITIRDMVQVHQLLQAHLDIEKIFLLLGGSQGAQQCLEWAVMQPDSIQNMALLATNARHSAWGIAFNEAQRMALDAGEKGILAARAIAMLSYRNYEMYERTQLNDDPDLLKDYGASTYQRYQGEKLAKRFDADCYFTLSRAMDTHHIGRKRGAIPEVLGHIKARTLIIGISSDGLFPVPEQAFLAEHIPGAIFSTIDSPYGHDGFLTEGDKINDIILKFITS